MSSSGLLSLFGGGYSLDASTSSDDSTIQVALELTSSALYTLSQRRLSYSLAIAIPAMTDQLKRDADLAAVELSTGVDSNNARRGLGLAAASALNDTMLAANAGLSSGRRMALLTIAERATYTTAITIGALSVAALGQAYDEKRKRDQNALSYLYGDIEHATKIRGLADALQQLGMSSTFTAAKSALSDKLHALSMEQIKWQRDKSIQEYEDARDASTGGLIASLFKGAVSGYTDAKKG